MADTKISTLPPVPSINGTEVIPVAKSGTTQGSTVNQIKTFLGVSGTNTGDQDLSGLALKTTTINSHPLSSDVIVTASDVGLGNVDNTADANKPISSATSTALSGKQATLVSGVSIKTINGSPVLGSGDLVVSGSGTVTVVGIATANGFAGTVANSTSTPSITLTTNLVGLLKGNGTAMSAAVAGVDYAEISSNTFTGVQIYSDQQLSRGMTKDMGVVFLDKGNSGTAAQTLDYSAGSHQKITVTGAFTLSTSNWPPTGNLGELLLELTNGGSSAVTWPTINWVKSDGTTTTTFSSNGVTLQSSGIDWILLWSRDAGTTVYGKVMR